MISTCNSPREINSVTGPVKNWSTIRGVLTDLNQAWYTGMHTVMEFIKCIQCCDNVTEILLYKQWYVSVEVTGAENL